MIEKMYIRNRDLDLQSISNLPNRYAKKLRILKLALISKQI